MTDNQYTLAFEAVNPPMDSGTDQIIFDFTTILSSVNYLNLSLGHHSNPGNDDSYHDWIIELDTPAAGQVRVTFFKHEHVQINTIDLVTAGSQPSGVTLRNTSGGVSSSEASHTHDADHDHGSFNTGNNNFGGGQVLLDAIGPALEIHTHACDPPVIAVTTGPGAAHNHVDNTLYNHQHEPGYTAAEFAPGTIGASNFFAGTSLIVIATGVKI